MLENNNSSATSLRHGQTYNIHLDEAIVYSRLEDTFVLYIYIYILLP